MPLNCTFKMVKNGTFYVIYLYTHTHTHKPCKTFFFGAREVGALSSVPMALPSLLFLKEQPLFLVIFTQRLMWVWEVLPVALLFLRSPHGSLASYLRFRKYARLKMEII